MKIFGTGSKTRGAAAAQIKHGKLNEEKEEKKKRKKQENNF